MDKNIIYSFIIIIVIGIFIIIRWFYKPPDPISFNDECIIGKTKKLEGILFSGCFDIWHISHFLLWFIIGMLTPNHYLGVITISVLWELFEHFVFKHQNMCKNKICGRIEDPILNIIGYSMGSYFKINGFKII